MKLNLTIVFAATILSVSITEAQVRTVTKTGPNGKNAGTKNGRQILNLHPGWSAPRIPTRVGHSLL